MKHNFAACFFIILMTASASVMGTVWRVAAQDTQSPSAVELATLGAEVRSRLAKELGLSPDELDDNTDLVKDMGLDQGVVFYAVQSVLDSYGVESKGRELTRASDIQALVAQAQSLKKFKKRGFLGVSPVPSYNQTVFYVTDRKATGETAPEDYFGSERSVNGALSYGRAEVNIPYYHKAGRIETPWLKIRALRDPRKHLFVLKLLPVDEDQFFNEVAEFGRGEGDVLVYVHGFNVSFDDAIVRAGQIAFDFGFSGAPIVYSWPSLNSVVGYNSDWGHVNWSTKHIAFFLETLAARTKGRKVHLVAHSMGSKGLLNALRMLANSGKTQVKFGSVLLCAPDYDAVLFREQIAGEIKPLAAQWVVYTSKKDIALIASEKLNMAPRLGRPVTYAEGYEIIDASEIEVTPWSVPETHSYYAVKKVVLDDMVKAIAGLAASARGLKSKLVKAGKVWAFRPLAGAGTSSP
jgi:esterase/lipase superfamily enzyme